MDSDNFPDGIVALRVNDKDTETLLKELSRHLGSTTEKRVLTDVSAMVQGLLRERKSLLIFDNADRARDLEKIRELIEVAKRYCPVIVTSRRIDLLYELDISDEGLINVEVLPQEEALTLLGECLQQKAKVIRKSLDVATTITTLLGGLPLALQIAGRTLRMRLAKPGLPNLESYAKLLKQAREEWKLPGDLVKSDDPERNLRISFHLSLEQLKQKEADFFICLSICPLDQFSRDEAEAIGEVIGLKKGSRDIDECFYAIWDVSLINFVENDAELLEPSEADDRYQFHPLIHQFAAEELAKRPDLKEKVEIQYANYFIYLLKSSSNQKIYDCLDSIVCVAKLLNEQDREEYTFAKNILNYLEKNQSARRHGVLVATEFYNLSKRLENWQEFVDFGFRRVDFLSLLNKYPAGIEILTQMQPLLSNITHEEGRLLNIAKLLNRRGWLYSKNRHYPDAMSDFNESLSIGRKLGKNHHVSVVLNTRGGCLEDQGELDQAKQDFEESLSISRRLLASQHNYALRHIGQVSTSLGRIYQRLGDSRKSESNNYYHKSEECLRESCEIRRKQSDDRSLAIALDSYGQILCKLKEFEQAKIAFDESIDIEKRKGTNKGVGTVLNNKGAMLVEQKAYYAAIEVFQESLKFLSKIPDQRGLAMVHNRLGQAYQKIGESKLAIEEFKQSFEINEKKLRNSQKGIQDVAPRLIKLLKALGKEQESRQYCQRAKTIVPTIMC